MPVAGNCLPRGQNVPRRRGAPRPPRPARQRPSRQPPGPPPVPQPSPRASAPYLPASAASPRLRAVIAAPPASAGDRAARPRARRPAPAPAPRARPSPPIGCSRGTGPAHWPFLLQVLAGALRRFYHSYFQTSKSGWPGPGSAPPAAPSAGLGSPPGSSSSALPLQQPVPVLL